MSFFAKQYDKQAYNFNEKDLLQSLYSARKEWDEAIRGFDQVTDPLLVDYFTFRIMACQARYQYFIQQAKENGIKCEGEYLETGHLAQLIPDTLKL